MKIESCRICGTELEVNKKCDICNEANQFCCHSCGHVTDEQIHAECNFISLGYKLLDASTA